MPESVPVTTVISAGTSETALVTTNPVPGSQGPTNVDNPATPVIPQVIIRFYYSYTWGATTTALTLRCRRGVGTGGAEVLLPGGSRPLKNNPAAAANPDYSFVEWVDTNVPLGTVYTITGAAGVAAVTVGNGYVSTNDCT